MMTPVAEIIRFKYIKYWNLKQVFFKFKPFFGLASKPLNFFY